jgi:16S rRNA (uracil1498-N3)-methyltransferase
LPPRIDFTSQRLFLDSPMVAGAELTLDKAQANYLLNVLRMGIGAKLLVFNGVDGEWQAVLSDAQKKSARLTLVAPTRPQSAPGHIWLCFAPIKSGRLDYMVEKAVEMGAAKLIPMLTNRTQGGRAMGSKLNLDRMRAHVIEAAEQCGVLAIPEISEEMKLPQLMQSLDSSRTIIFCDEAAEVSDPLQSLASLPKNAPVALFIGPEGGFDENERQNILRHQPRIAIALGPRILRADTAAVAAMAALQMAFGDWK